MSGVYFVFLIPQPGLRPMIEVYSPPSFPPRLPLHLLSCSFIFIVGINRLVDQKLRHFTKEAISKKKLASLPRGGGKFECRLSKGEHLQVICDALRAVAGSRDTIFNAFRDTGMLGPQENWSSFYRQQYTWKDGSSQRGPDCPVVTSSYLDQLFRPLNLAQPLEAPMVLPLEELEETTAQKWKGSGRKTLSCSSGPRGGPTNPYALLSFIPHWYKGANQAFHAWKSTGVIVDADNRVSLYFLLILSSSIFLTFVFSGSGEKGSQEAVSV